MEHRETALDVLATLFTGILAVTQFRRDEEGKQRKMYSLRHTAIVRSVRKGMRIEMIAQIRAPVLT
jgi:hypothetical protein